MQLRSRSAQPRGVFVTVGTTSFDALARAVDDPALVTALEAAGYTSLTLQLGRGAYTPTRTVAEGRDEATTAGGFTVRWFRFAPALDSLVAAAALVVSHAGAGSIFEALRARKPLLVVVNTALMDNHQTELAEALAAEGYLGHCAPDRLKEALAGLPAGGFAPYPPGDAQPVARAIDELMGW